MSNELIKVGGQAVVEGVMMRTAHSFTVAVRRSSGQIVLTESPWNSLFNRFSFLRWPFFRGTVVLLESMINGIGALNFSAKVAMADEELQKKNPSRMSSKGSESEQQELPVDRSVSTADGGLGSFSLSVESSLPLESSRITLWFTLFLGLALGVGLFVALPHLAVWAGSQMLGRELNVQDFLFHLIVGIAKMGVFIAYIGLISLMEDVRRLFMYHGAEHQSIYTYEARQDLTVENAKKHSPLHPRCGTTFLIMVIAISILVFSLVFPLLIAIVGEPTGNKMVDQLIYIGIKLPLLFPIAGLSYEFQKMTGQYRERWWAKMLAWPGLLVQRLTTRPPTEDQLEVALTSLRKALWREKVGSPESKEGSKMEEYPNFEAVVRQLGV